MAMKIPTITNYRVEEVEVPAPKAEQQIINEALGLAAPALPPGPPRKMLKITLEADEFPMMELPLALSVGSQVVTNLAISGGGTRMSGLIETMPQQGERIVLHLPSLAGDEGVVLAGLFDRSRVTTATA
jgi:hypothetical protein